MPLLRHLRGGLGLSLGFCAGKNKLNLFAAQNGPASFDPEIHRKVYVGPFFCVLPQE